jgi:hypothetical protein
MPGMSAWLSTAVASDDKKSAIKLNRPSIEPQEQSCKQQGADSTATRSKKGK